MEDLTCLLATVHTLNLIPYTMQVNEKWRRYGYLSDLKSILKNCTSFQITCAFNKSVALVYSQAVERLQTPVRHAFIRDTEWFYCDSMNYDDSSLIHNKTMPYPV